MLTGTHVHHTNLVYSCLCAFDQCLGHNAQYCGDQTIAGRHTSQRLPAPLFLGVFSVTDVAAGCDRPKLGPKGVSAQFFRPRRRSATAGHCHNAFPQGPAM